MIPQSNTPRSLNGSGWRLIGFLGALLLPLLIVLIGNPALAQQTDKQRAEEIKKVLADLDKLRARLKELEAPAKPATPEAKPDSPKTAWVGSIKVEGKQSGKERAKLAKVAQADAEKTALAAVKNKEAKVEDIELEVKNGFLVWVVDVEIGKAEVEVIVDAGNGKVLAVKGEGAPGGTAVPVKEAAKPVVIEIDLSKLPPDLRKELEKYTKKPK